ncbi:uncharacterized protein LOC143806508 isoform X2 [Ranitomeya variabilis]|uniref:uncharacterized protein LOC143806508 isoform X2 n=1 Tax=Ranitomeya variabilis TaxID=490064 RepID=UPI004056A3F4
MICLALLRMYHRKMFRLCLLLFLYLHFGELQRCDEKLECQSISIKISNSQITVTGLSAGFFLQKITDIDGNVIRASDNSLNNTSLMSLSSGTQYVIYYGDESTSCCHKVTTSLPISSIQNNPSALHSAMNVEFSPFHASYGDIVAYAVVVTTDMTDDHPPQGILSKTYDDFKNKLTNTYVTYILGEEQIASFVLSKKIGVHVGDGTKTHSYYNGPLDPQLQYRVSIAGFNIIQYDLTTDTIIEDQSLLSFTDYMGPYYLITETNTKDLSDSNIQNDPSGGAISVEFSPFHASYGDIVAYAVVVTTEMTDDRPPDGILSKTYDDFKNKLTNTYVTYILEEESIMSFTQSKKIGVHVGDGTKTHSYFNGPLDPQLQYRVSIAGFNIIQYDLSTDTIIEDQSMLSFTDYMGPYSLITETNIKDLSDSNIQDDPSGGAISVEFSPFHASYGDIVAYAVVVTTEMTDNRPPDGILSKTYDDFKNKLTNTYVTYILEEESIMSFAQSKKIGVHVGDGTKIHSYFNGPLDPQLQYRVSIAGFNIIQYDLRADTIIEDQSLVSFTDYMGPYSLITKTNIKGLPDSNIQNDPSGGAISVEFSPFHASYGDIVAYAVVVTTEMTDDRPPDGILSKTYDDFNNKLTNTYVTYILEEESIMSFAQSKKIGVHVGDGTKTHSYFNGPLDPQLQYRVSIAGFNIIQYDLSTDTIIEDQSMLSFTDYMGPYSLITKTNIKGLPDSNIQTDPSGGAISVEFSPFHASYGDIVAYAVVVTTEMTDDRPPDGILSKTYNDFKNKLTNTYVTYILEEESIMSFAQSKKIGVHVGDGTKTHSYFNGPLDPQLQYRFSIAGFNIIQYDLTTDTIIEDQSMVSFTDYMGPYSLSTETSLTSFNTISKIGSVESTYTGSQPNEHGVISVEFSPFHASYGDIVAYAAVVTTEMNADQPPQGILSKTYDDFKNKLTDTYVTSILGEELIASLTQSKKIGVHVGDGTKTHSYFNGPLDPELQYRVSIAGFNIIQYDLTTDTIIEDQSLVSFTDYMGPYSLITKTDITSVNTISEISSVESTYTGLSNNDIQNNPSVLRSSMSVEFSPFHASYGDIVAYAVIVTTEMNADLPPSGILLKTYDDFKNKLTDTYVTYILEEEQIAGFAQSKKIGVHVGDGTKTHSYFNGPLDPQLQYRVSIAGFNIIQYDLTTDTIIEDQSLVSFTDYMGPYSLITKTNTTSFNTISTSGSEESIYTDLSIGLPDNDIQNNPSVLRSSMSVEFSPFHASYGDIVAYAVVVTTEMNADRPPQDILSKTYDDFTNKLTDTYVTYILEEEQIASFVQPKKIGVHVGDGTKTHSYFNGPLDPQLQYRVSIAGFNIIQYDLITDTIIEDQSLVSFTRYMGPFSLITKTNITSSNAISKESIYTGLPSNNFVISQSELGDSMDLMFSPFNSSNGPIVAYAVVVTTETNDDHPTQGILSKTYNDFKNKLTDTYVTYIFEEEQIVSSGQSNMISVLVGDGSKTHSYFNGPLDPELQYRVSIAGFNNIKYDTNTDTINEEQSRVSFTSYMDPSSVLTRKTIHSVNEISRIDYVEPSFTGLTENIVFSQSELGDTIDVTFSPLDNSNGPVVAYAVVVTTEMTDNHPPQGILSKTYEDFQNKLTDTYVTYILEKEQIVSSGQPNMISFLVGDGSKTHSYVNGPLDPELQYRVSIAGFNNIKYDTNTDTINEEQSRVSFTSYMDPSSVLTRKNINSVNEISRIDYREPSFTGLTENIVFSQSELGDTIDVTFSPLDNSNGPVVAYAVVVTTEMTEDHPPQGILSKTYEDFQNKLTDTYVTYILEKEQIVSSGESNMISVLVGDGSKSHSYFNGPLDPELQYRVSIAGFNNIKYDTNTDTINEEQSRVSFTSYMDPSSVLTRKTIYSVNEISRIDYVEPSFTGLTENNIVFSQSELGNSIDVTFSPLDNSNGPVVAYAVVVTTEMTDDHPPQGILSKTYEDFQNKLTDTYVTYILEKEQIVSSGESNMISVLVGDGSKTHSYVNGPLDPELQYRVSIAEFNNIKYDTNTDTINEEQSIVSFTSYMDPSSVLTRKTINSVNENSRIDYVEPSFTGLTENNVVFSQSELGDSIDVTFSPLDNSNGPVVAYAVVVTTEMTDDRPPQGILSKTHEDFQNKLTDTYVTYIFEKEQIVNSGESNMISVLVGDGSKSHSYVNGPLDPELQYRVSIAEFNNIKYDTNTDTINEEKSIVSFTSYMDPSSVLTRKNINSVNEISRIDYVKPSFTGLTKNNIVLSQSELGDSIDVTFSPLDNSNGPVVAYAVVVTSEMTDDHPPKGILSKTYNDFQNKLSDTYVTYILEKEQIVRSGQSNMISVLVGDGSKSHSYFNGPLDPELQYRVSIAEFNNIKYDTNTDTINEEQSMVSFTSYMDPSSVLTRKNINSVNEISRIDYVKPSFTGLTENNIMLSQSELGDSIDVTFSPLDNSNGPVVAYAVVVTTELTDDHPRKGILSKTYNDFQNKLTNTYVTYIFEKEQIVSSGQSNMISVLVGDGSKSHSYFNGPLDPELQYRVSIASFNNIKYNRNKDTINEKQSMVSFTNYMDPSSVLSRSNINSLNAISRIGAMEPPYTELLDNNIVISPSEHSGSVDVTFSPFISSNEPIVAYAAIITTEMNDNRPPWGVLSKTYNDFTNNLTNTYVTYIFEQEPIMNSEKSNTLSVIVGDKSKTHSYFNGPLDPKLQYRVCIAGFNEIMYDPNTDIINEEQSLASFTSYMGPFSVPSMTNNTSLNKFSTIGNEKTSYTGIIVGAVVVFVAAVVVAAIGLRRKKRLPPILKINNAGEEEKLNCELKEISSKSPVLLSQAKAEPSKISTSKKSRERKGDHHKNENGNTEEEERLNSEPEQLSCETEFQDKQTKIPTNMKLKESWGLNCELEEISCVRGVQEEPKNISTNVISKEGRGDRAKFYNSDYCHLMRLNCDLEQIICERGIQQTANILNMKSKESFGLNSQLKQISYEREFQKEPTKISTDMISKENWGLNSKLEQISCKKGIQEDSEISTILKSKESFGPNCKLEQVSSERDFQGESTQISTDKKWGLNSKLEQISCKKGIQEESTEISTIMKSKESFGPNYKLEQVSSERGFQGESTQISTDMKWGLNSKLEQISCKKGIQEESTEIWTIMKSKESSGPNCKLEQVSSERGFQGESTQIDMKSKERLGLNSKLEQISCKKGIQEESTEISTIMKSKESSGLNCKLEQVSSERGFQGESTEISTDMKSKERLGLNCELEQVSCERGIQELTKSSTYMKPKESQGLNCNLNQLSGETRFQEESTNISTDMTSKESHGLNREVDQLSRVTRLQEELTTISTNMSRLNCELEQISCERGIQEESTKISTNLKSMESQGLNSELIQHSGEARFQQASTIISSNMKSKESWGLRFMESENYEALFKNLLANNCSGFNMEYDTLKSVGIVQSRSVAVHASNKEKNRQDAAYPYDTSRVTLLTLENSSDGYINASYIPGYRSEREFIAAQHPLPGTMKDFWYMIWEQRVNTIVMLSSKQENYQGKGEEYWPKPEAKTFGCIIVTFMHEHIYNSWTIRDFMVTNLKDCTSQRVRQFHFTEWHQSGKMDDREVLMQFVHEVRQYKKDISSNCPTVVHCRTGTGRSGIFIALDCIINQLECDKKVDVCGTVHKMHLHRPLMVQTVDQYIFLHCCTLDIIRDKKKVNTDDQKVTEDRSEDAILHTVYYHSHTLIESTQGQPSLP